MFYESPNMQQKFEICEVVCVFEPDCLTQYHS